MKLKTTLLAAAATLAIAPAAQAYEGIYGAIGAGLNYMDPDTDVSNDGSGGSGAFTFDSDSDYSKGIGAYVALGKAFGNGFRGEIELSYRNNDIRHIASDGAGFSGWPSTTISGDTKVFGFLANVLYDFETGGPVTPYLGAGVGGASVDHDIIGSNPAGAPTAPMSIAYGNSKIGLAYQGIAGVAIDLAEDLVLDISYRYFATKKQNYTSTLNGAPASIAAAYEAHSLFAGLRWNFGSAAPAPVQYKDCWDGRSVPMSAECPPQPVEDLSVNLEPFQFVVYFDLDKSNLSATASDSIREASAQALQGDIDTVVVSGNTDTSGSSAHNQALSQRRAKVVYDALVANGVPADMIRMEALGETNPAQPTADGVREPLNRRTEVTISFE